MIVCQTCVLSVNVFIIFFRCKARQSNMYEPGPLVYFMHCLRKTTENQMWSEILCKQTQTGAHSKWNLTLAFHIKHSLAHNYPFFVQTQTFKRNFFPRISFQYIILKVSICTTTNVCIRSGRTCLWRSSGCFLFSHQLSWFGAFAIRCSTRCVFSTN